MLDVIPNCLLMDDAGLALYHYGLRETERKEERKLGRWRKETSEVRSWGLLDGFD